MTKEPQQNSEETITLDRNLNNNNNNKMHGEKCNVGDQLTRKNTQTSWNVPRTEVGHPSMTQTNGYLHETAHSRRRLPQLPPHRAGVGRRQHEGNHGGTPEQLRVRQSRQTVLGQNIGGGNSRRWLGRSWGGGWRGGAGCRLILLQTSARVAAPTVRVAILALVVRGAAAIIAVGAFGTCDRTTNTR